MKHCVNIEFSFPKEVESEIIKLASILKQKFPETTYVMDGKGIFPHLTLHYMYLSEENLNKVPQLIKNLITKYHQVKIKIGKVESYPNGIVTLTCDLNEELKAIHEKIITVLESVRDGSTDPDFLKNLDKKPEFYKTNLKKYGHPYVLDNFRPHIALARINKISKDELNKTTKELNNIWKPLICNLKTVKIKSWITSGGIGKTIAEFDLRFKSQLSEQIIHST